MEIKVEGSMEHCSGRKKWRREIENVMHDRRKLGLRRETEQDRANWRLALLENRLTRASVVTQTINIIINV